MKNRIILICDWILIMLVLAFVINETLTTAIKTRVIYSVNKDGKNKLTIGEFHLNVFTGNLKANEINLDGSGKIKSLRINHIDINGISLSGLLWGNHIGINEIHLIGSTLFTVSAPDKKDTMLLADKIIQAISNGKFDSYKIGSLMIEDCNYRLLSTTDTNVVFSCNRSGLAIFNINAEKNKPSFKVDSTNIELNDCRLITNDKLYTLEIEKAAAKDDKKTLMFSNIRLISNYTDEEFFRIVGKQTDRFNAKVPLISASGFDAGNFFLYDSICAALLKIDSAEVDIYRNKYFKYIPENKKMLREILNSLPMKLSIDECNVGNSTLTYKELSPPNKKAGEVKLKNIKAEIHHITNLDTGTTKMSSECKVGGKSPLIVNIQFPSNTGTVLGKGHITNILMKDLNAMMDSYSPVIITNGYIDSMHFDLVVKEQNIYGTVLLLYDKLRVTAIDPETKDTTGIIKDIKTAIANDVILKKGNLHDGKVKNVNVNRHYQRERFITNNILKTIIEGIEKTIK